MNDVFKYDILFKNKYVLASSCALARCGLIILNGVHLDLQTKIAELDGFHTNIFTYHYNPNIDYCYEVKPSKTNPLLLQPSKERAIVECILHLDWIDEGLLIEGLKTYLDQFYNELKLQKVAKHFNLHESKLKYWINEAINDLSLIHI